MTIWLLCADYSVHETNSDVFQFIAITGTTHTVEFVSEDLVIRGEAVNIGALLILRYIYRCEEGSVNPDTILSVIMSEIVATSTYSK